MKAEGDAKTNLLAEATQLQEQQTALMDRVQAVVEELRKKGGEVDVYEKYIKTVSGVKVDVSDAGGNLTLVTGWLQSPEGGLRWAKNALMFLLTLIAFKILSNNSALKLFYVHACKPTMSLIRWVTSGLIPSPAASWSRYFFSAGVSTSIASREAA
jgi:hypothetical protein